MNIAKPNFPDLRELFPEEAEAEMKVASGEEEYPFYWFCNYDKIVDESFGLEILVKVEDQGYQGDTRYLFRDELTHAIGILIVGWGSCSGCDALQACENFSEVEELRDRLFNDIKWFSGYGEALEYILQKDWELEWCWYYEETKKFLQECVHLLSEGKVEFFHEKLD